MPLPDLLKNVWVKGELYGHDDQNKVADTVNLLIGDTHDLAQLLQNKTLDDTTELTIKDVNFVLEDNSDLTKQLKIDLANLTASTTRTLAAPDTAGVIGVEQMITQINSFNLVNQTAAQKMFSNGSGQITVAAGTYFFESLFTLSGLSTSSSTFGWDLTAGASGPATITSILWHSVANKNTLNAANSPQSTVNVAANTGIVSSSTSAVGWAYIRGKVRIASGGTLVPKISLGTASAAVVGADSYFRIWNVGSSGIGTVGAWT